MHGCGIGLAQTRAIYSVRLRHVAVNDFVRGDVFYAEPPERIFVPGVVFFSGIFA